MAESLNQEHESAKMQDIHCASPMKMKYSFLNDLVLMFERSQREPSFTDVIKIKNEEKVFVTYSKKIRIQYEPVGKPIIRLQ